MGPFLFYSGIYSIMAKKLVITESQLKRMVQNEQLLKDLGQKIKSGVSTGLDQVKTGINKVATKVADLTQKPQPQQAPQTKKPCSNPYLACIQQEQIPQLIKDWSAVNTDMSNLQGFGMGIGQNDHMAEQIATLNAKTVIMNEKLKVNRATFGINEIKKTYCDLPDGTIQYFVVLEKN